MPYAEPHSTHRCGGATTAEIRQLSPIVTEQVLKDTMRALGPSVQTRASVRGICHPLRFKARAERCVQAYAAPEQVEASTSEESPQPAPNTCAHCGVSLADVPFGCDQLGHKAGGMGAFFEWWPVKAWGPCEKASAAGLAYTRKGQGTDEMLFGPKK